jgi:2-polyprenyl-3-methyl-5-hydroxy-6-metoxy-1,4-benzoquinol methylase
MAEDFQLNLKFLLYGMSLPIISSLVKNHIAEKLQESPKTTEELCSSTEMESEKLFRYLRIASSFDLFKHDQISNKWSNTKDSLLLTTQFSHNLWAWTGSSFLSELLTHADIQLKSRKPPMETLNRRKFFEELSDLPEVFSNFQNCMSYLVISNSVEVIEGIKIEENAKMLDVGGATGNLAIGLAKKYINANFAVFDRHDICNAAKENIEKQGMNQRVLFFEGDFFDYVPDGFDCIVMKNILHDWNDEDCVKILSNCRKVLKNGDKMFVVERLIDENSKNYQGILALDHILLMCLSGKDRGIKEFERILEKAGFGIVEIRPALFQVVIEARAV